MAIEEMIDTLKREMEIEEDLSTAAVGVFEIPLDTGRVRVQNTDEGMYLFAEAGPCPSNREEEFYTQALTANLFGQGTMGANLGLSYDGNTVTLAYNIDWPVTYAEFKEILEDFLNAVSYWQDQIS